MPTESTRAIQVTQIRPDIALITMDLPGSGANILNDQLFAELDSTMESLAERSDLSGVILYSAKPTIFVAGADLKKIVATLDWPDKKIVEFCEKGRAVMARFSRCPFVSVAAIHGACVGGGLELPLWCDYRVATNDRRTVLGLPEVKLGLVPGWAGTVRLPRIASLDVAVDLVTSGRLVSAAEAKTMGFVDTVVDQAQLLDESVALISRMATSESFVHDRKAIMGPVTNQGDPEAILAKYAKRIVDNKEIYLYAPTVAIEHMVRSASLPIKPAWNSESVAMSQVYGSPASRGLLNHFFLVDRNKKQPGLVDLQLVPEKIETLGIVGAGLMGRSIAETCLKRGIHVVLLDAADGLAASVAQSITQSIDLQQATLTPVTDYAEFANCQLVIESVVETIDVKKIVLEKIEAAVSQSTIIASNTSAIPISKLGESLRHPERFCGIHFCHPELMSLVEVISGDQTSEQTISTAVGFVRSLRKMPVAINDGPGFIVNRLLAAMIGQAIRLFAEGVSITAIDEAMREFGFLGGPFEIIDVIGADTCMYAGRTMWESGLNCVTVSPVLPKMVKSGRLGRKSDQGFYHYDAPKSPAVWNDDVLELIGQYRESDSEESSQLSFEQIANQILSVMVLEATNILEEEIAADFRDLDLSVIHGFSFPKYQGGILFWADRVSLALVQSTLEQIGTTAENIRLNDTIKAMADSESTFYS